MKKTRNTVLLLSLGLVLTGCSSNVASSDETDSTATTEATTEITSEVTTEEVTTTETTEAPVEENKATVSDADKKTASASDASADSANTDKPAVSAEEDDARYNAFFENNYAEFDEKMYISANNVEIKYAYADLDKDGTDEMLLGNEEGVFSVITEVDGSYNESDVNGWIVQYGATPGEYIGNGCFMNSISNGNNYGGEFRVDVIWKYNNSLKNCGVLARLSSSWDPNNMAENYNNWELYVANDENVLAATAETSEINTDNTNYTYSYIDFGDNYNFVGDELEKNDLINAYDAVEASHKAENALASLDWKPVAK